MEKNSNHLTIKGMEEKIERARQIIEDADAVFITTGAGMGIDSGLPDFRGNQGFWNAYPEAKKRGLSFIEMANPEWFHNNPELAWAFYGHRLHLYRDTIPHEGFELLLQLGRKKPEGCFVFTSNVDGQFQKAGFDSKKIVEAHGSIHHFQCSNDCVGDIWGAAGESIPVDMKHFRAKAIPRCPHCGAIARPNILMFGDWHWNDSRYLEQSRRMIKWLDQITLSNAKLAIIEIGAGTALSTVRKKSETVTDRFENILIRINPREDDIPNNVSGIGLAMGGLEGLRSIVG